MLRLSRVACRRGGRLLFAGVDLSVAAGGAALVSGPNGVGKSSLLRLVAGLLTPYAGTVEVHAPVALADEQAALDRDRTLAEALAFWAGIDGIGRELSLAALDDLAIAHLADIPVRMLSTGQRKRAALARVIAGDAPIWLLDEPANGLDTASIEALSRVVARHRARGGAIVAASHQPLPWAHDLALALTPPAEEDTK